MTLLSFAEINTITNEDGTKGKQNREKQAIVMEGRFFVVSAYCVTSGSVLACLLLSFTLTF